MSTKFRPILFSTPMVQAMMGGKKTQTRRVIKPQPTQVGSVWKLDKKQSSNRPFNEWHNHPFGIQSPYGQVGDVLWVKETHTWVRTWDAHDLLEGAKDKTNWVYKASMHDDWMHYAKEKYGYKWKPSIFMPKAAARIFLRITDIRVERLQDISEEDAIAESFVSDKAGIPFKAKSKFFHTWEEIYGEESLSSNPWVWVITFERIEKPENFPS